jgi:hypothetical protein
MSIKLISLINGSDKKTSNRQKTGNHNHQQQTQKTTDNQPPIPNTPCNNRQKTGKTGNKNKPNVNPETTAPIQPKS